jgi:hypothetical protein
MATIRYNKKVSQVAAEYWLRRLRLSAIATAGKKCPTVINKGQDRIFMDLMTQKITNSVAYQVQWLVKNDDENRYRNPESENWNKWIILLKNNSPLHEELLIEAITEAGIKCGNSPEYAFACEGGSTAIYLDNVITTHDSSIKPSEEDWLVFTW